MKISVIVLCHNNFHINKVVDTIAKQLNTGDELFVVDDHSTEDVRELLKKYDGTKVEILTPETKGNRSANRNLAANRSTGDLLLFVDGDVLLASDAIELVKSFDYSGISGLCGSVAAMRMTPETISIATHNYFDEVNIGNIDFDSWHERFPDFRNDKILLAWNRFYTAFSVIPREAFYNAGCFDESFIGWGGEDIDLGYRLLKHGKLLISRDIRAVHIPHSRNIPQEEQNGRRNMYKMLKKYRNRDMEELISFALTPYITEGINSVLARLQTANDDNIITPISNQAMVYYAASAQNPNGKIVYNVNNEEKAEEFIGVALPFTDGHFDSVVTTTAIFDYPEGLATRILQELLRVSKKVEIVKVASRCIEWGEIENLFKYVFCYHKTYLFADSYQDFSIRDCGSHYLVV